MVDICLQNNSNNDWDTSGWLSNKKCWELEYGGVHYVFGSLFKIVLQFFSWKRYPDSIEDTIKSKKGCNCTVDITQDFNKEKVMAGDQFISAKNFTPQLLNIIKIQIPSLLFSWITSESNAGGYQVQLKLNSDERSNNRFYWGRYLLKPDFGPDIKHEKRQENDQ